MTYPYIVIDAPGFYGDEGGRVYSVHATLGSARRAMKRHVYTDERGQRRVPVAVAYNPGKRLVKGDTFYRDMTPVTVGY